MLNVAATIAKPFSENVYSLLLWSLVSIGQDGDGTPTGERKLQDYFEELYRGKPSVKFFKLIDCYS